MHVDYTTLEQDDNFLKELDNNIWVMDNHKWALYRPIPVTQHRPPITALAQALKLRRSELAWADEGFKIIIERAKFSPNTVR